VGWRAGLVLLGRGLLIGGIGYVLMLALGWLVIWLIRDVLPQILIIAGMTCAGMLLWPICSLATWWLLFGLPRARREMAKREAFESRMALTEAEFACLFPAGSTAIAVRAELRRFIGRADIADRLLPSDLVLSTCALAGFHPCDIDWVGFLCGLETQFRTRIPDEASEDMTVSQLVGWCTEPNEQAEPGAAPDPAA
jgi:hypothetical protein